MNALQSLLPTGRPVFHPATPKHAIGINPPVQFDQLLVALSADLSEQETPEELPLAEIAAALEQLVEMPTEELTEEQQALQYAIFQLLAIPDEQHLKTAIEAHTPDKEVQERMFALVSQVKSLLLTVKEPVQLGELAEVPASETAPVEQARKESLAPLLDLLEKIDKQTAPAEKILLLKEIIPAQEARPAFAQTPLKWLQVLKQEEPATENADDKPVAPVVKADPETGKPALKAEMTQDVPTPKAEPTQTATAPKIEANPEMATTKVEAKPETAMPKPEADPEAPLPKADALPQAAAPQTSAAVAAVEAKLVDAPVRQVPVQKLADTLAEWIGAPARLTAGGGETRLRINIFPEHLGHLEILVSTVAGKVSAQIVASHGAAKEAVEFQLNQLRVALVQQGVEIDRLEVREDSSSEGFQKDGQQRPQPESSTFGDKRGRRGETGEAAIEGAPAAKRTTGSPSASGQVDYTV